MNSISARTDPHALLSAQDLCTKPSLLHQRPYLIADHLLYRPVEGILQVILAVHNVDAQTVQGTATLLLWRQRLCAALFTGVGIAVELRLSIPVWEDLFR